MTTPEIQHTKETPVQATLNYEVGRSDMSPERYYVRKLIREVQEDLLSRKKQIIPLVVKFLIAYDMIKGLEEDYILLGDPPLEDKIQTFIGSCTAILKGVGSRVIEILDENNDLDIEETLDMKVEDFQAIVEELKQLDFSLSNDMTDIRKEEIKKIFCGD